MRTSTLNSFLPTTTKSYTRTSILDPPKSSTPLRLDGRSQHSYRGYTMDLTRGTAHSTCTLTLGTPALGSTTCITTVTASLTTPARGAPSRGFLNTSINYLTPPPPKSSSLFTSPTRIALLLTRLLGTNASSSRPILDLEALVVIPGVQVWRLSVEVLVLDASDGGNIVDAGE